MGDRTKAREEVDTALSIDPDFLAARMLRDELYAPETSSVSAPPASQPAAPAPVASLAVSAAKLAQVEERVRQRVRERAAQPSPRSRASAPPAAPAVAPPATSSRRGFRIGAVAVAAAAFAFAVSSSVQESRLLYSHATVSTGGLVQPATPDPIEAAPAPQPRYQEPLLTIERPFMRPSPQPPPRVTVTSTPIPAVGPIVTPPPVQAMPTSSVVTDSPPPAVLPRSVDDRAMVEETLSRYRRAYNRLDARSAQVVYPAVNASALARAFDGLQSQSLQFDECEIDVRGGSASVTCRGTSRYVPKVGSRDPHVEPRVWDFTLRKDAGDWKIENARAVR